MLRERGDVPTIHPLAGARRRGAVRVDGVLSRPRVPLIDAVLLPSRAQAGRAAAGVQPPM